MSDIPIQIVNDQDKPIGSASIAEAQKKGLLHRIARVMVEDPNGNILLQKRVVSKGLYPGRWDNSAAGHVDEGEDYLTAARRELFEEIGLQEVELQQTGYYRSDGNFEDRKLHRFNTVYKVVVPTQQVFKLEPDEVSQIQWFSPVGFKELVLNHSDSVTDGILEVFERYYA